MSTLTFACLKKIIVFLRLTTLLEFGFQYIKINLNVRLKSTFDRKATKPINETNGSGLKLGLGPTTIKDTASSRKMLWVNLRTVRNFIVNILKH